MTKEELKPNTVEVFANYPEVDKVYACEDGTLFFNKNDADLHASEREITVVSTRKAVYEITRAESETVGTDETNPLNEGEEEELTDGGELPSPPEDN